MRKIGRYRKKKQKKILIIGSLSLLLFLCIGYAAFQTNLSITAKGNIKEQTRVIQSWDANSQTDFHSDFYKQNIVSATFLDNNNVPSNAAESWNVSEDKRHGGVMAWVIPNSNDNTKYDLYIGARGGVIANEDSSYLFYLCTGIEEIDFNDNFDTNNVVNMSYMFAGDWNQNENSPIAMSLKEIKGLENWKTNALTNMLAMFHCCTNLTVLDLSSFDTSKVINMSHIFAECYSLENIIGVENLDTSKVTNFYAMFWNCSSITNLNLCSFSTESATDIGGMFAGTLTLEHVYVGEKFKINDNTITHPLFDNSHISQVTTGQC